MKGEELREMQAPLKTQYREQPESAVVTLRAVGELGDTGLTCKVDTGRALVEAGLHPATGGNGLSACSGDMLLEALVACAGVTLKAVATALDLGRSAAARSAPRAISIFAERSASPRRRRSASATSGWASSSTPTPRPTARDAAEADRALLRRAADPALGAANQRHPDPIHLDCSLAVRNR